MPSAGCRCAPSRTIEVPTFVTPRNAMHASQHNLPVTIAQVLAWIRQCNVQEKHILLKELLDDTAALTIASEPSLSKDWDDEAEDEAWKEL